MQLMCESLDVYTGQAWNMAKNHLSHDNPVHPSYHHTGHDACKVRTVH